MSWPRYLPKDRLRWTSGPDSGPVWPSEPDLNVIAALAAKALGLHYDTMEIRPLATGANHKVYNVISRSAPRKLQGGRGQEEREEESEEAEEASHVFRVALPIDPRLKIESEMATLAFIRERTTIPVPQPVAWQSSLSSSSASSSSSPSDNPLGYEWALVTKVPGVELRSVWRKMPWERKLDIAEALAVYLRQLWAQDARLPKIGSLFFKQSRTGQIDGDNVMARDKYSVTGLQILHTSGNTQSVDAAGDYDMGPAVDGVYYAERRCYLESHRGPFESCREWLASLIDIEEKFIVSARQLLVERESMTPEHTAENWDNLVDEIGVDEEDLMENFDRITDLLAQYRSLLPTVFSPSTSSSSTDDSRFVLHHCDLRAANIMVDPKTYKVTGVIDWEQTCALPAWYAIDYPLMINTSEPYDDQEPALPTTYDEDDPNFNWVKVSKRDQWEGKMLRNRFDASLDKAGLAGGWKSDGLADRIKSKFIQGVGSFGEDWETSQSMLESIRKMLREKE